MSSWTNKQADKKPEKISVLQLQKSLGLDAAFNYELNTGRRKIETLPTQAQHDLFALLKLEEKIATAAFAQKHGLDMGDHLMPMLIHQYVNDMALFDREVGTNLSGIRGEHNEQFPDADKSFTEAATQRFHTKIDHIKKNVADFVEGRGAGTGTPG